MAGDEQVGQDEIEKLLREAQEAAQGGAAAETPAPNEAEPAQPVALEGQEVEALVNQSEPENAAVSQTDVEALLQQSAQGSASPTSPPTPPTPPPAVDSLSSVGQNDIEVLLNQAEQAIASIDQPVQATPPDIQQFELRDLSGTPPSNEAATLDLLQDVNLDVKIELGRTLMQLEDVLQLKKGAVVPLDKLAGDPVDIYVNGRLIARGEVLVLNDNFCVRVAELAVGESAVA